MQATPGRASSHDAIVIGAGPAGLSAARALLAGGVRGVVVLERNTEAGGLPRFCGHIGWGVIDFHRCWRGPTYARHLVAAAAGADIRTGQSVTALLPGGEVVVSGQHGSETLRARAVLVAAGIREMSRPARLVSGTRPWGVTSTGAFQDMVYKRGLRPFSRPLIVGSELVSFSALLTARHAGIRPVAMIEANARITARRPGDLFARHLLGVPVRTGTRLVRIEGQGRVSGVVVEQDGVESRIDCDGLILTGRFVPETGVLRSSHLAIDPATGGPAIDTEWRCSDPAYFAAGNVLRPVEHSGAAATEGLRAGESMVRALRGEMPGVAAVPVRARGQLQYVYPQGVTAGSAPVQLFARASAAVDGTLRVTAGGDVLMEKRMRVLPERRLTIDLPPSARRAVALDVELA